MNILPYGLTWQSSTTCMPPTGLSIFLPTYSPYPPIRAVITKANLSGYEDLNNFTKVYVCADSTDAEEVLLTSVLLGGVFWPSWEFSHWWGRRLQFGELQCLLFVGQSSHLFLAAVAYIGVSAMLISNPTARVLTQKLPFLCFNETCMWTGTPAQQFWHAENH